MSRLLIVEDSPTQAAALRFILESEGFVVETAADGEKGLQRLLGRRFDAVISDIVMPSMSGYEFCKAVRATPDINGIPIMLLTTLSDPMDIIKGLECGADNFSTKPYDATALVSRVRTMLQNKTMRAGKTSGPDVQSFFLGRTFPIRSEKERILDMLLSTFEDIVRTNRDLESREMDLAAAKQKISEYAKRLEGRAPESEGTYAQLIDHANEAMFVIDEHGQILEANRRAALLLASPVEDIVGQPFLGFVSPEERADATAAWRKLCIDGRGKLADLELQRGGAGFVCADLSASVVTMDGRRISLAIVRDMTERNYQRDSSRQAGIRHGRRQGLQAAVETLLRHKFHELVGTPTNSNQFGRAELEQLEAANPERLERYLARMLTAKTVAEVFAEPL